MARLNKKSILTAAAISLALGFAGPMLAFAATAPSLGTASTYGVVASTFTNSNTSPQTIVQGDVCYTTGPTTVPLVITGSTVTPCPSQVGLDQTAALNNVVDGLNTQACTAIGTDVALDSYMITPSSTPGHFIPGCYSASGAMTITVNQNVNLDGAGVYIFKAGGALTTAADTHVLLNSGATAANVFWAPIQATTIGAHTGPSLSTATFVGNILDAAGISIGHFANLNGKALAFGGTVTTDANTISGVAVANLNVIKLVVNSNGGIVAPSIFSVHVKRANGAEVSGSPAAGLGGLGTAYSLSAGTYTVSEDSNSAYVRTFSGACDSNGSVTIGGADRICTIINTDVPVPGFSSSNARIVPMIGIVKVPTPLALPAGSGPVTYNYTVWNVGGQQALTNVSVADDKCSPVALLSGDVNGNNKLDPHENWKYSCATNLATTTTNTAIATGHSDDAFNQAAFATALATVVVGKPTPAPIINIVKVPSRLTPFPVGGGNVTYTYTVTNPGVVAMHDVAVTDDKCAPVSKLISGDVNGDKLLQHSETWTYTCKMHIAVSTRNIATAKGSANGFTAIAYAFANVFVTPGLPNTGLPPAPWNIVMALGILAAVLVIFYFARRKKVI